MSLPPEALDHYLAGNERTRLASGSGRLEFLRSMSIIRRFGPSAPAQILDVGGGTGPYAFELARLGYQVDLVDAVPLHIDQALSHVDARLLHSATVGDARALSAEDDSYDAVFLMGPLYHLVERDDRLKALRESHRVLRSGGMIFAAAISQYASLFDGFFSGFMNDPVFESIVERDLQDGQHRNPTNHPHYFTSSKFHSPTELELELSEAGFSGVEVRGIEGFGWLLPGGFDSERLLRFLELVEANPELRAVSAHLMAVGRKG